MMNKSRSRLSILRPSLEQVQRAREFLDGLGKTINTRGPISYKRMIFQVTVDIITIDGIEKINSNQNLLSDFFHAASFDCKNNAEEFALKLNNSIYFVEVIKLNKGRELYEIFFRNQGRVVLEDISCCTLTLDVMADENFGKYEGWKIKRFGNRDWRNCI
jgi:hypothetical protein